MAKKGFFMMVLAAFVVGGVFAQEGTDASAEKPSTEKLKLMSVGFGVFFDSQFGSGIENGSYYMKYPYKGFGPGFFLDATYVEASIGWFLGYAKENSNTAQLGERSANLMMQGLHLQALGKYPFRVREQLLVYPLLGIDYQLMVFLYDKAGELKYPDTGKDLSGEFSALWFRAGGGLDIIRSEKNYIRIAAVYGVRLSNKWEDKMSDAGNTIVLAHGLKINIAWASWF